MDTYTTKQLADAVGIHVNTVRFYEEIGFLTKPQRTANGYRVYTDLQLAQCRLIRRAMRAEVLQNGLRKKAIELVRLCAEGEYDVSLCAAAEYRAMIASEIMHARAALDETPLDAPLQATYKTRAAAATALGVTTETVRTWERNGLLTIHARKDAYTPADMARLNLIRTLRCANYSLSAILRLLTSRDTDRTAEEILNAAEPEEIVTACDHLLVALQNTAEDAEMLVTMLEEMKQKFSTPQ